MSKQTRTSGFTTTSLHSRGFTLVELLITVSIIAILAIVGIVIYTRFLQNARDAKRQADLRAVQSALEQYFADQFSYPARNTSTTACPADGSLNLTYRPSGQTGCPLKDPENKKIYINELPSDPFPTPQPGYCFSPQPSGCSPAGTKCTSYSLFAKFENVSGSVSDPVGACGGYNFKVSPP